ncbi:G-type lectin S-receptor-like serine/threonine-protein kinase At4g27290 [Vigna radiata var. radiata]|uniref:Receptor-like serine/threonine-protein kinase n=1 Tax=Vigna radiata var. radiata TaxID=3916 RepID=A0A1S3W144_VIGRR|nr:G-type lectin S-receptor-like serine/threonine-protein kinase At4g27290 [Vigna radiata var. radiata]
MERVTLLPFCLALLNSIAATTVRESINVLQSISDGQVIVSPGKIYALGFFSPGNSKNRYVGIWYNEIPTQTAVWVANRDNPLNDSSGVLKLNETGVLVLLNHNKSVIWSSNTTGSARHPVAKLLDTGNLIVQNGNGNDEAKDLLWQSFDYPGDTLLPGQKFGRNLVTGLNRYMSSWNSSEDPSHGVYNYQLDITGYPQFVLREGTTKIYRFGSWNGVQFSGAPLLKQSDYTRFTFISNEEELYFMFEHTNKSFLHRMVLTTEGRILGTFWDNERKDWSLHARIPVDDCDYYGKCGAYATCNIDIIPPCQCLDGFVPKTADLYGGCVRRTSLSCHEDEFSPVSGLKLPDTERSWFSRNMSLEDCKTLCRNNCSCKAYAALDMSKGPNGCLLWFNDLVDIRKLTDVDEDVYVRMASSELKATEGKQLHKSNIRKYESVFIICVLFIGILILCLTFITLYKRLKTRQKGKMEGNLEPDVNVINEHESKDLELPMFELSTITSATNNFSPDNKLGEGGFGSVYKGILADGGEIAVKRLSMNSKQGLPEFKNEVMHIAKLQHRNLVRLLGYCLQAGERLLVYEFMPNKSLDSFIFDENKSMLLDWPRRMLIINGVARGLLYLHQDSRHRIVHRDLKAGNVLLDSEMNPKISDFGLARSFGGNEIEATTKHVVGTYGYLPPEYIIDGAYSTKSDVFSYGVLILEIVSGKRNKGFCHQDNLLAHVWRLFTEGKCSEVVDAAITESVHLSEALRTIHVGLLCVQLNPEDRPNMSSVVMMLSSESALPQPNLPGFFTSTSMAGDSSSSSSHKQYTNNDLSLSIMSAR